MYSFFGMTLFLVCQLVFWCTPFLVVSTRFLVYTTFWCVLVFWYDTTFRVYSFLGVFAHPKKHQKRVFLDPPKMLKNESAIFVVKNTPSTVFCGDFCSLENTVLRGHFTTKLALEIAQKRAKKGGQGLLPLKRGPFLRVLGLLGRKRPKMENGKK